MSEIELMAVSEGEVTEEEDRQQRHGDASHHLGFRMSRGVRALSALAIAAVLLLAAPRVTKYATSPKNGLAGVTKSPAATLAVDLVSEAMQATIGARLKPSVHQRLLAPKPATSAELKEAANNTADMAHVMFVTGARKLTEQSVTLAGPDGTSTMDVRTVFSTKNCEDLTATDLPHLSATYVQQIATMFIDTPAPKPVCAVAFGVLVVNAGLKAPYAGYTQASFAQVVANMIAGVLDQDGDGVADDPKVMEFMRTGPSGRWLHSKRTGINKEETWKQKLGTTVQVSEEHDFKRELTILDCLRNHFEETYHTYQTARGQAYPSIFGFPDVPKDVCEDGPSRCNWASSIATRCSAMAQCNWWSHPECTCKKQGDGASSKDIQRGGCASPSCAGIEWDYDVDTGFSNNYALSHGNEASFWKTRAGIEAKLTSTGGACTELLAILKDPQYHVVQKKLSYHYTATVGSPAPAPGPAPAPAPTPPPTPATSAPTSAPKPASTPTPPSPSSPGLKACEGHSFTRNQCINVGCCFFEEGKCYADQEDRCETGGGGGGGGGGNGANAGLEACEGHDYDRSRCRQVGCCSYDDGQCWARDPDHCEEGGDDEEHDEEDDEEDH